MHSANSIVLLWHRWPKRRLHIFRVWKQTNIPLKRWLNSHKNPVDAWFYWAVRHIANLQMTTVSSAFQRVSSNMWRQINQFALAESHSAQLLNDNFSAARFQRGPCTATTFGQPHNTGVASSYTCQLFCKVTPPPTKKKPQKNKKLTYQCFIPPPSLRLDQMKPVCIPLLWLLAAPTLWSWDNWLWFCPATGADRLTDRRVDTQSNGHSCVACCAVEGLWLSLCKQEAQGVRLMSRGTWTCISMHMWESAHKYM